MAKGQTQIIVMMVLILFKLYSSHQSLQRQYMRVKQFALEMKSTKKAHFILEQEILLRRVS